MITSLPTFADTDEDVIAAHATDTVWLRANLNLLCTAADDLLRLPDVDAVTHGALHEIGAAWHHAARLLAWQGYPHPLDEGTFCGEPRCSANCADFD